MERNKVLFVQLGFQYYVSGRFAARGGLMPVSGNLFHHAVEMLLKGHLATTLPLNELRSRFGHRLREMWNAFKQDVSDSGLD